MTSNFYALTQYLGKPAQQRATITPVCKMLSSPDLSFSQTLPIDVFNQLGELLEQMAQTVEAALVLTEAVLLRIPITREWRTQRFTVVISKGFTVLLVGSSNSTAKSFEPFSNQPKAELSRTVVSSSLPESVSLPLIQVNLTFDTSTISAFLQELLNFFGSDSQTRKDLEQYCQTLEPNNLALQEKFTFLLLKKLLRKPQITESVSTESNYLQFSACQHVEDALQKQVAQEKLLNQVTTQIRKSLDLSVIMTTAIAQVREFLELDRLVIYKFDESPIKTKKHPVDISSEQGGVEVEEELRQNFAEYAGCIVYEVRASDAIPSVLNYKEENCFTPTTDCWDKYRHAFTLAVNDVEKTYALEKCLLKFLQDINVRAKLVAPIIFENKLWGLLIAHQCYAARNWHENEKSLLSAVAEQLAIAIYQSALMNSLTEEKQNLEERVIERTMALHDALQAAEAASRIRSEFLATISHELLTPLTYVIGMSSTLLRWSFGELSQRQRDYLQTIHDSGEHLLDMINDILDLSQIEAGKAVLNITSFSLKQIVEEAVNSLQERAAIQQIELKLDLGLYNKPDTFNADARRVQQILINLLSNAVKFTPENGNVTLRLWWEETRVVFQVEDTGIGIPEEQLPQLFEKFHQLDTPYRRRYGGTGLGLALTKQLVQMHRGRIEVESTVGMGSIFTVWIPEQPCGA